MNALSIFFVMGLLAWEAILKSGNVAASTIRSTSTFYNASTVPSTLTTLTTLTTNTYTTRPVQQLDCEAKLVECSIKQMATKTIQEFHSFSYTDLCRMSPDLLVCAVYVVRLSGCSGHLPNLDIPEELWKKLTSNVDLSDTIDHGYLENLLCNPSSDVTPQIKPASAEVPLGMWPSSFPSMPTGITPPTTHCQPSGPNPYIKCFGDIGPAGPLTYEECRADPATECYIQTLIEDPCFIMDYFTFGELEPDNVPHKSLYCEIMSEDASGANKILGQNSANKNGDCYQSSKECRMPMGPPRTSMNISVPYDIPGIGNMNLLKLVSVVNNMCSERCLSGFAKNCPVMRQVFIQGVIKVLLLPNTEERIALVGAFVEDVCPYLTDFQPLCSENQLKSNESHECISMALQASPVVDQKFVNHGLYSDVQTCMNDTVGEHCDVKSAEMIIDAMVLLDINIEHRNNFGTLSDASVAAELTVVFPVVVGFCHSILLVM